MTPLFFAALLLAAPPEPAKGLRAPHGFEVTEFAGSDLANDISLDLSGPMPSRWSVPDDGRLGAPPATTSEPSGTNSHHLVGSHCKFRLASHHERSDTHH
jgi:hypothetical protein